MNTSPHRWSLFLGTLFFLCLLLPAKSTFAESVHTEESWQTRALQGQIVAVDSSMIELRTAEGVIYRIALQPYTQIAGKAHPSSAQPTLLPGD
jgi:hypothetical protein